MAVAYTEDDCLLFGAAGFDEIPEEVLCHGEHAVRQQDTVLVLCLLVESFQLLGGDGLPSVGIDGVAGKNVGNGDAGFVEVHPALLNLTGGEITVFDALAHVVLIHRLAEVMDIVGGDLGVGHGFLGFFRWTPDGGAWR
jgi:hypothetical protein